MPGQGFYSIHIPTDKEEKTKEVLGIMIIEYGMVTADCIGKELRHLFKGISKWSIKKMNEDNQYLITFPSESIREQFSRFRGFDFQTSIVKAKVIPTEMSYGADDNLDVVRVKAFNLPPNAKNVEIIMEVAYLVGDPEEVDTTSLKKPWPFRIKPVCRDAFQVRGETQIFFNGKVTELNGKWRIWVKRLPKMITRVSSIEGKIKRMRKRRKKKRVNMLQVRRRGVPKMVMVAQKLWAPRRKVVTQIPTRNKR
ncbi:hypothetical protein C2845_PM12G09960 [Panicum miliaceum]|uniref:Uncharacterized protein n=1 Tax=Panicum miliaceum TaxID=4540 RepID=A0A3L6QDE4_PANMI|nr:hypothetical protein C2845_PM12G09960 [Panicum miliaceum]